MGIFDPHAAVQRHEALAGHRELDDQHRAGLSGGTIDRILLHRFDFGVGQQRNVEFRGLLGLAVEPQTGGHFGHPLSSFEMMNINQALARDGAAVAAATSIHITSQIWPSGSSKLRPYMKP